MDEIHLKEFVGKTVQSIDIEDEKEIVITFLDGSILIFDKCGYAMVGPPEYISTTEIVERSRRLYG